MLTADDGAIATLTDGLRLSAGSEPSTASPDGSTNHAYRSLIYASSRRSGTLARRSSRGYCPCIREYVRGRRAGHDTTDGIDGLLWLAVVLVRRWPSGDHPGSCQ